MKSKTRYDVWGVQHNCVNYDGCPLCYGCRAYDPSYVKCQNCAEDMKKNVCNRELHREKLVAKMITRERIVIKTNKGDNK